MQVVLARLAVDVRRLVGELGARRMDRLAARAEHRGHRLLRQPLDLEPGHPAAQLVRDRHVPPGVAEADRRGHEQRPLRAHAGPPPRPGRRRLACDTLGQLAQQQVDAHRIARLRRVPGALEGDQLAARQLGQAHAALERNDPVLCPVHDDDGTPNAAAQLLDLLDPAGERRRPFLAQDERLRRRVEPPGDAVLDLLRRVRLGEDLAEEELQEAAVVLQPVVAVELRPSLVALELLVERVALVGGHRGRDRQPGVDHERAVHTVGMAGGEDRSVGPAPREARDQRRLDPGRVEHGDRVGGDLVPVVDGLLRPVGEPVAAAVERDHAEVPREVRDLRLPVARVHDQPRGQEQDRRLAARRTTPSGGGRRRARRRPARRGGGPDFRCRSGPRGRS